VMTLNFEAGYMHAVFPHATTRRILAARAGSIYDPLNPHEIIFNFVRIQGIRSVPFACALYPFVMFVTLAAGRSV
jgi:hypothetical protein